MLLGAGLGTSVGDVLGKGLGKGLGKVLGTGVIGFSGGLYILDFSVATYVVKDIAATVIIVKKTNTGVNMGSLLFMHTMMKILYLGRVVVCCGAVVC